MGERSAASEPDPLPTSLRDISQVVVGGAAGSGTDNRSGTDEAMRLQDRAPTTTIGRWRCNWRWRPLLASLVAVAQARGRNWPNVVRPIAIYGLGLASPSAARKYLPPRLAGIELALSLRDTKLHMDLDLDLDLDRVASLRTLGIASACVRYGGTGRAMPAKCR